MHNNICWLNAKDELKEAVLLVFANKQDLPNAVNVAEITDKLGLHSLRQCHWYINTHIHSLSLSLMFYAMHRKFGIH